jgi:hypothetical protein
MWKNCEITDFLTETHRDTTTLTPKKYHGCTIKGCTDKVSLKPADIDEVERFYKDPMTRKFLSWKPFKKNKYCLKHWWSISCDVKVLAEKKKQKWVEKYENTLFLNGSGDLYTSKNVFIGNMTKVNHSRPPPSTSKDLSALSDNTDVYDDLVREVIEDDTKNDTVKDDHNPDDEDGQYEEDSEDSECEDSECEDAKDSEGEVEDDMDGLDEECF